MRKVIVTEFISLDGVMETPEKWTVKFRSDETEKYKLDEVFSADALLLGRKTYEGFAKAWPKFKDETGFADRMNGLPKYVVSGTLDDASWNNSHVIRGDVAGEVRKLKEQPGQDILVYGSATLANSLLRERLVDVVRLLVFPIVLGSGKPLFEQGLDKFLLVPTDTRAFASGVVLLDYGVQNDG